MKAAAFVLASNFHLLDHIAPLAFFLKMPLFANDEETAELAKLYYPEVETRYWPDLEFRLQEIANEFDTLFNSQYWEPAFKECFRLFYQKEMKLVFCPHGQSDKGYKTPLLDYYQLQDAVLIYGDLLQEMLTELNVWDKIPAHARVGNYRLAYHKLHQKRGAALAEKEIFSKLTPQNRTLLYAPTWNDSDGSTSFFLEVERLVRELPTNWNLLIKLHPLLQQRDPALFAQLTCLEEQKPNLQLVHQFPLIYPILEKIDAYLGDYSSIGYDVLAFQKPMFFQSVEGIPQARLHACGHILTPTENIFSQIERGLKNSDSFLPLQKALYKKAFDEVSLSAEPLVQLCQNQGDS